VITHRDISSGHRIKEDGMQDDDSLDDDGSMEDESAPPPPSH
jgi:hypothetical protein